MKIVAYQQKKLFINECIIIFPTIYFPAIISARLYIIA